MIRFLFLTLVFSSLQAWSYPELVRHGYTRCTVCHTELSGGGLLTSYGRSLSREVLSQPALLGKPSVEGDEQFLYGLAQPPEWLLLGGNVRVLQLFVESKQASRGRFLWMQVEFDASAQIRDWLRVFASIGRVEPRIEDATAKDFVTSPRHGVEFLLSPPEQDERTTLKLGRFLPAYGIQFAEHTFVTRSLLGFNPGQERYAGELAWTNDRFEVIATGITSQANFNQIVHEEGGALQLTSTIGETSKVGVNYYSTRRNDNGVRYDRRILGAFAEIGFSHDWYGLLEVDQPEGADKKKGFVEVFKLGREIRQGLHLFGVHEFANLNMEQANPKFEAYSLGVQWFPRPHWELYSLFRKERNTAQGDDFSDVAWFIGHFYL